MHLDPELVLSVRGPSLVPHRILRMDTSGEESRMLGQDVELINLFIVDEQSELEV